MISVRERSRIYKITWLFTILSVLWIVWNILSPSGTPSVCIFNNITGIKCPSCGITGSVLAIMNGEFIKALEGNPLSYLAIMLLVIIPVLLFYDVIKRKNLFFRLYKNCEVKIQQNKILAAVLISLISFNWLYILTN